MILSEVLIRFFLVFVLSFIYGLNRQRSHKPVGFGTFILISVGACALAVIAVDMNLENSVGIIGAIVTGIGFLGAGALIKESDKVFGFTTAASIWFFAIFGLSIGLGEYLNAGIIYLMVWAVAIFDKYLEKNAIGSYRRKIVIQTKGLVPKEEITGVLVKHTTDFYLYSTLLNKKEKTSSFTYVIEGPKNKIEGLLKSFYSKNWCLSVRFD
ncbi:MAG: MgtC/SapB family protein [Candidatus Pacearchaeota archaeon]|nr:MgtC/SapB family protein [Candidatus Pacearchaeota archaeon]